ncbi:hypothetical protein [Enterobacter mori]|uniref:hypothetical protein n=1 Tax=Enterobacter mori TaxID=539813 RepID=UPI001B8C99F4|nr:hypothetical protein [Enterobacter mori]MBS3050421.1 hypothetical protein [Enterobacter mori]
MITSARQRFISQQRIFLAPGLYFHADHSGIDYTALPPVLQKAHNQRLLRQYDLPLPTARTPTLPDMVTGRWSLLPEIAWVLGIIQHTPKLPWWLQTSRYVVLHQYATQCALPQTLEASSPREVLAGGAAQLLSCLTPFGSEYTVRASFMFSHAVRNYVTDVPAQTTLPWNIFVQACHAVGDN